jgi:chromosomal replication initiation ATPase DnaA
MAGEGPLSDPALGPRQLALPFPHAPHYGSEAFLEAASNAEALHWLCNTASWPLGQLALWGPEGCGKTHLLHLWAKRQGAVLLAGPLLATEPPVGSIEAGLPVLLAGRAAPARWNPALPDLASRLRAITAVRIGPAEDELLRDLLARLLRERQLTVAEAVQDWLLLHLPRSQGAIREAVARLDHAALAAGGGITRTLAQAVAAGLDRELSSRLPADSLFAHADTVTSAEAGTLL